jgi:hypothetical protein
MTAYDTVAYRFPDDHVELRNDVTAGQGPGPRTVRSDIHNAHGYPLTAVLTDNTAEAFGRALEGAPPLTGSAPGRRC